MNDNSFITTNKLVHYYLLSVRSFKHSMLALNLDKFCLGYCDQYHTYTDVKKKRLIKKLHNLLHEHHRFVHVRKGGLS